MKPLRIAMIGQRSIPATYGGVERAVEELGARLVERGHSVTAFCWRADRSPKTYRGIVNRNVPAIPGKHLRAFSQSVVATVAALSGAYDVVHFHAMGPALCAPLLRLRPSCRIVATVQGRDDRRSKWGPIAQRIIRIGAWSTARVAHETIVVSRQLEEDYRIEFDRESTYIPNGVDDPGPVIGTEELERMDLKPNGYFLYVGRLVPEKGIDMISAAYSLVDADLPMVIVGSAAGTNSYVEAMRTAARGDSRVQFVGERRGEALRQLYSNARAVVMPSHLEGLPIVLLEAVSFGTAVVCSDIAPILEVVGTTSRPGARIFRDGDVHGFAEALRENLSDSDDEIEAETTRLRREVLQTFSWAGVTDRTEAVYADAVASRRRTPRASR